MAYLGFIEQHAEIVGADGVHVGTVDHIDGESIVLAENGGDAGGIRHISGDMVVGLENGVIRLNVKAEDVVVFEPDDTTYQS